MYGKIIHQPNDHFYVFKGSRYSHDMKESKNKICHVVLDRVLLVGVGWGGENPNIGLKAQYH